jgi:hypothetical protein
MSMYNVGYCDNAVAVTPSDTTVLTPTQCLYVGTTGNVAVVTVGGQTVTFTGVPAGTTLPIRCSKVNATNTTASTILALY